MPGRRNPPARWVLPSNVYPPSTKCFQIEVPDDPLYIAAFRGALLNLASARQWQDDPAHTALLVAAVWRDIYDAVLRVECNPIDAIAIAESDYEMTVCEQLRFSPDTGKLQGWCCGEWTDIAGQDAKPDGGQWQLGTQITPPKAGDCFLYHAIFPCSTRWLLPAAVNSGDTLTFTNADGAGDDGALGAFSAWRCPDGGLFVAGLNIGSKVHSVGDLSGSAYHMEIIALINGVYYPADTGIITVPGGVVNASVYLLCNDATIGDNSGNMSVDIELCNNATVTFTHRFDFTTSSHGWVIAPGQNGIYVPGVGFQSTTTGFGSQLETLSPTVAAHTMNSMEVIGTRGHDANTGTSQMLKHTSGGYGYYGAIATAVGPFDSLIVSTAAGVDSVVVDLDTNAFTNVNTVSAVVVTGLGPDPYAAF